jgi:hypothetical protein
LFVPECGISRVAESRILGGLDAGKIHQINYIFIFLTQLLHLKPTIFMIFEGG